jgi:hypothetical protein
VKWPDTSKLEKGVWVKVRGGVSFTPLEGKKLPAILVIAWADLLGALAPEILQVFHGLGDPEEK